MAFHTLTENVAISMANAPIAAASSTNASSTIYDLSGAEGITFIVPITDCVATGVATIKVQHGDASDLSDAADVTGATATATCAVNDDLNNTLLVVEVRNTGKAYARLNIASATANIAFGNAVALIRPRRVPVTNDATVTSLVYVAD
jgi:hypothetical protein